MKYQAYLFSLFLFIFTARAEAESIVFPRELSFKSRECFKCHREKTPSITQQWGASKHYRSNVGCYECHQATRDDPDVIEHYDEQIAIIVTPKDCGHCHDKEFSEFNNSHHSIGGRIIGSLDNRLAEVVEGNRMMKTPGFPDGVPAAAVTGCWQCHGSEVRVLQGGKLDPATWPNSGIGRINPDGSEGACTACHPRHRFSVEQARSPESCGKCHMGPDHPQIEIYEESKHGNAFLTQKSQMNLGNEKWVVGEDYSAAPTCATCHMSATPDQEVTHDIGLRISWNNRPVKSIRPEVSDAKLGLPGKDFSWEKRRERMKNVCMNCHNEGFIDNFYAQYDGLIALYNEKFAQPGKELMELAQPLLKPVVFGNKIDFIWFELWHHEGRRARHGVSMMGPGYTHWHGMYDVAKNFYTKFIPELEEIIEKNLHSEDSSRLKQAKKLQKWLDKVLASENHRWFINKMDPEEAERRKATQKEFQEKYKK